MMIKESEDNNVSCATTESRTKEEKVCPIYFLSCFLLQEQCMTKVKAHAKAHFVHHVITDFNA